MKSPKILLVLAMAACLAAALSVSIKAETVIDEPKEYKVVGLAKGKTLQVKKEADPASEVIEELHMGGYCVTSNGETKLNGKIEWMKIFAMQGEGWVPKKNMKLVTDPEKECPPVSD